MSKEEKQNRINISENRKMLLFAEVDGMCPMCTKSLMYSKAGKLHKFFEIAHIYPLNPTESEKKLLENEELLSKDRNDNNNLIALCTDCHTKFDKPKTIKEYREMVNLKKKLMNKSDMCDFIYNNPIEDDIKTILMLLTEEEIEIENEIKYNAKKLEDKMNDTILPITKRSIKRDVAMYYTIIRKRFKEIDSTNFNIFEIISLQIKTSYLKLSRETDNQQEIFEKLVEWLNKRTKEYSIDACKIVVSFFIQNCEVF